MLKPQIKVWKGPWKCSSQPTRKGEEGWLVTMGCIQQPSCADALPTTNCSFFSGSYFILYTFHFLFQHLNKFQHLLFCTFSPASNYAVAISTVSYIRYVHLNFYTRLKTWQILFQSTAIFKHITTVHSFSCWYCPSWCDLKLFLTGCHNTGSCQRPTWLAAWWWWYWWWWWWQWWWWQ